MQCISRHYCSNGIYIAEEHGREYQFVSRGVFEYFIDNETLLEWYDLSLDVHIRFVTVYVIALSILLALTL